MDERGGRDSRSVSHDLNFLSLGVKIVKSQFSSLSPHRMNPSRNRNRLCTLRSSFLALLSELVDERGEGNRYVEFVRVRVGSGEGTVGGWDGSELLNRSGSDLVVLLGGVERGLAIRGGEREKRKEVKFTLGESSSSASAALTFFSA